MSVPSLEQLKKKEVALKQAVADQGESTDAAKRRALGKKLRRVQRKRRRSVIEAARRAPKAKPGGEETTADATPAADSQEAKAE